MAEILLLTPQLPYPPQQGTSLRNFHLLRGLALRHRVTLLSLVEPEQRVSDEAAAELARLCARVVTVSVPPRSPAHRLWQLLASTLPDMAHRLASERLVEALRGLASSAQFDIIQIEGIELARTITTARLASPNSLIVFDDHNAETALQQRAFEADRRRPGRWPAALYSWVQVRRLRRFERWACHSADGVVAVSARDRQRLRALGDMASVPIEVVPNSIAVKELAAEVDSFAGDAAEAQDLDLLFLGKMDYRANVDAVLWFADEVWPLLRAMALPGKSLRWAIVGQRPHRRLRRLPEDQGIRLSGRVDSVLPYLVGARVFIMPFRVGGGTRLKLIEALAAGKAVVSTALGAEGFPVQDGRELRLVDSAEEMAQVIAQLLGDEAERRRLGAAGRALAAQYDWRVTAPLLEQFYQRLLAGAGS